MKISCIFASLALVAGLALAGCSDDGGNGPQPDGIQTDGGTDGQVIVPEAGTDGPIGPSSCDPACTAEKPYLCVKDSSGDCIECNTDADCAANPNSLGPTCDTSQGGICTCATDGDCAGNPWGATCDTDNGMCSCSADSECTAPKKCVGSLFGASVCSSPCTSDTDCTSTDAPKCDTASGSCVECLADGDCSDGWQNKCDTSTGDCVECLANADCSANEWGGLCDQGICTCKADTDCQTTYAFGGKCVTISDPLFGDYSTCGCEGDAQCAGNPHGPTCYVKGHRCSCTADAQCTTAPYSKCGLPAAPSSYLHCQKACATDADCPAVHSSLAKCTTDKKCVECVAKADCTDASSPLCKTDPGFCVECMQKSDCTDAASPFCNLTSGSCVECEKNTDCTANQFEIVCDTTGDCIECLQDSDCGANSFGPKCDTSYGWCVCASDADCANQTTGLVCDPQLEACTCSADTDCPTGKKCTGTYGSGMQYCE